MLPLPAEDKAESSSLSILPIIKLNYKNKIQKNQRGKTLPKLKDSNFAKDNSLWNGLSLKNNFLELDVRKTAGAADLNAHSYLGYDSALLISRKDNVRVFD